MKFLIFLSLSSLCTGCAIIPQYGDAGVKCGLRSQSFLMDPTLEQIKCLEDHGVKDSRLDRKKEELMNKSSGK